MPINLKMHKITNNVPTVNPLPEGGTTGQALVKKSDTPSDVGWSDIVGGYTKPESGIPKTDLDSTVQTSLGLADTALQSFTETDPVFGASAASGITSTDISNWNGKQAAITDTNKLSYSLISGAPTIPDAVTESTVSGWGFTKNTGTYSKPNTGIPKTDLASAVQTSLGKADTALQSYTETDPTVPAWAKAENKPTYTASEVGALASTVTHLSGDIATTEKGAANGVATLGSDGKVPSTQLPSYVDDVLEYNAKTNFPTSGESGKIYIDKATNITYRWGGSDYVAIGSDLALGETSSTAYAGDKGKANADAISTHTSNGDIHVTTTNKTAWNAKYDKPSGGIPKTDLASAVQTSLGKADTALQSFTETDPTVPSHVKNITSTDISNWNGKQAAITSSNKLAYSLISGTPTIPTVNNATLTINQNGTQVATFTANSSSNVTANITALPLSMTEKASGVDAVVLATTPHVYGLDTKSVLASGVTSYTATEDCWAQARYNGANSYNLNIDGVNIRAMDASQAHACYPLSKGQTIQGYNSFITFTIYKMKVVS